MLWPSVFLPRSSEESNERTREIVRAFLLACSHERANKRAREIVRVCLNLGTRTRRPTHTYIHVRMYSEEKAPSSRSLLQKWSYLQKRSPLESCVFKRKVKSCVFKSEFTLECILFLEKDESCAFKGEVLLISCVYTSRSEVPLRVAYSKVKSLKEKGPHVWIHTWI